VIDPFVVLELKKLTKIFKDKRNIIEKSSFILGFCGLQVKL
jgi:hypothetical protein